MGLGRWCCGVFIYLCIGQIVPVVAAERVVDLVHVLEHVRQVVRQVLIYSKRERELGGGGRGLAMDSFVPRAVCICVIFMDVGMVGVV